MHECSKGWTGIHGIRYGNAFGSLGYRAGRSVNFQMRHTIQDTIKMLSNAAWWLIMPDSPSTRGLITRWNMLLHPFKVSLELHSPVSASLFSMSCHIETPYQIKSLAVLPAAESPAFVLVLVARRRDRDYEGIPVRQSYLVAATPSRWFYR